MTGKELYEKYCELSQDMGEFDPWEVFDEAMHKGWDLLADWLEKKEKTNEN